MIDDPAVETTDETSTPATPEPTEPEPTELELWDRKTVLAFFGGSKPIHVSTLYRGVNSGLYPPPMNVAPNTVRWIGHECRAARQRMLGERGKPKQTMKRRGRKRRQRIA
jgi:predicted DNA-binding transcriptional regulator AlpA